MLRISIFQDLTDWFNHLTCGKKHQNILTIQIHALNLFFQFVESERFQRHTIASLVRISEFATSSVNLKFLLDLSSTTNMLRDGRNCYDEMSYNITENPNQIECKHLKPQRSPSRFCWRPHHFGTWTLPTSPKPPEISTRCLELSDTKLV